MTEQHVWEVNLLRFGIPKVAAEVNFLTKGNNCFQQVLLHFLFKIFSCAHQCSAFFMAMPQILRNDRTFVYHFMYLESVALNAENTAQMTKKGFFFLHILSKLGTSN